MQQGVLENLAENIVDLLTETYAGGLARYGTVGYTRKAFLARLRHLWRLLEASTVT